MKISWWLIDRGQRKPRTDKMGGPGRLWAATCICGWDSGEDGLKMGEARALVNDHKAEHGAGRAVASEGAASVPNEALTEQQEILQAAEELLTRIDALPGPEYVKRIAQGDAQKALELLGTAGSRSAGQPVEVGA